MSWPLTPLSHRKLISSELSFWRTLKTVFMISVVQQLSISEMFWRHWVSQRPGMAQRSSSELVSVLLFDKGGRVLLKNVENRGLWLPTEQKREADTIASIAQKIVDTVIFRSIIYMIWIACVILLSWILQFVLKFEWTIWRLSSVLNRARNMNCAHDWFIDIVIHWLYQIDNAMCL